MRPRERVIREQFAHEQCVDCGAQYPADNIVVLARRSTLWMVLGWCSNCQARHVFTVSFTRPNHERDELAHFSSQPPALRPNWIRDEQSSPRHSFQASAVDDFSQIPNFLSTYSPNLIRLIKRTDA